MERLRLLWIEPTISQSANRITWSHTPPPWDALGDVMLGHLESGLVSTPLTEDTSPWFR